MNDKPLHLMVRTREKIMFDAEVESVTANNEKGEFDVLARHSNFISLVKGEMIIRQKDKKDGRIQVDNGILQVREGRIEVYLGIKR